MVTHDRALNGIEVVEVNTRRKLTHDKDILIAFAGIVAQLELAWGGTYIADMWRTSLF